MFWSHYQAWYCYVNTTDNDHLSCYLRSVNTATMTLRMIMLATVELTVMIMSSRVVAYRSTLSTTVAQTLAIFIRVAEIQLGLHTERRFIIPHLSQSHVASMTHVVN